MQFTEKVQNSMRVLLSFLPESFKPKAGLILGTGLGSVANELTEPVRIPYTELPGYPQSTVSSHAGCFSCGYLKGVPVIIQEGRCHLYEGYSAHEVVTGVRVMAALGANTIIVTNAAGAINPQFNAGDVMLITDHINFTGQSPLTGIEDEPATGNRPARSRFTDMTQIYDRKLQELARNKALELGITLERGVYLAVTGPQMESPAETRMFRQWGADAVGMSTVMEVIAARHQDMRVLGLSCLSNKNLPDCMEPAGIEEVIRVSGMAASNLKKILNAVITEI